MKNLKMAIIAAMAIASISTITNSAQANAYTMSDIAGNYRITSNQIAGVVNLVTLKSNGDITLKEVSDRGTIVCKGQSKIADNLLRSIVKCADPSVFYRQQIDFSTVRNLTKFQAPVSSDLFGATLMMDFLKVSAPDNL